MKQVTRKTLIVVATVIFLLILICFWTSIFNPILVAISPNCSAYENGKQIESCKCIGFEQVLNEVQSESGYKFTQCVGYVKSVTDLE